MNQDEQSTTTMNQTLNAAAAETPSDPQASDVGTVGEQIPGPDLGMRFEPEQPQTTPEPPAAPPVITPTVGRKVWFFPNGANFHSQPHCIDPDEPMDADVVYVWGDRMLNLTVKDHIGQVHAFTSVKFLQPGDEIPISGAFAMWMPYQVAASRAAG